MSENDSCDGPSATGARRTASGSRGPTDVAPVMAGSPYPPVDADDVDSVLVAARQTAGRAAVIGLRLPAGAATLVRRTSTEDLAYLVLEGTVELESAGQARTLHALSAECIRAGVPHRYRALTRSRLLVAVSPAGVEQLFLNEQRLAREDPELLLALAQEHRVELRPGLA